MLMRSKVTHQGQGSSEVKLDGKCWFSLCLFEKLKSGTKLGSKMQRGSFGMLRGCEPIFF